jgi:hypothetical protein
MTLDAVLPSPAAVAERLPFSNEEWQSVLSATRAFLSQLTARSRYLKVCISCKSLATKKTRAATPQRKESGVETRLIAKFGKAYEFLRW